MKTKNQKRANKIRKAILKAYDEHDLKASIHDALTDLMHLCEAEAIDFDSCLSMATDHYGDEK